MDEKNFGREQYDGLKGYFAQARQHQLLTREDEQLLGGAIIQGNAAADLLNGSTSTPPEAANLTRLITKGEEAKKELVEHNLLHVVKVANTYRGMGLEVEDLIQEGNLGLIEAASKFDSTKGFKFSTYSRWWIRKEILKALADKGHHMAVPKYMFDLLGDYSRTRHRLEFESHHKEEFEIQQECATVMRMPLAKIQEFELYKSRLSPEYLDAPKRGSDEVETKYDFIMDEKSDFTEKIMDDVVVSEVQAFINGDMDKDEADFLNMRFAGWSYISIRRELGLSEKRVKLLRRAAEAKLRREVELRDLTGTGD